MSATKRVQQWLTMSRGWWLYDAKWQDPFESAKVLAKYLVGHHKPIYTNTRNGDFGDHVIVINSADIALKADDWYYRLYFHHSGYPGSASWTKAWEVHRKNPTMIVNRAVYGALPKTVTRRPCMARLHIFKDESIPQMLAENITDQIRPLRRVPKRLDSYTKEEQDAFPKIFDYPQTFVLPEAGPSTPVPSELSPQVTEVSKRRARAGRR